MTKTAISKIASLLVMLATLIALTLTLTVGASAEVAVEARWGTDAQTLTGEGTLQEAFDAAAEDASVTYVQLASNVDMGESSLSATGGAFTLDLYGHTVTSATNTLCLSNGVNLTLTDSGEGGTIESTDGLARAIQLKDTSAVMLHITGGTVWGQGQAIGFHSDTASEAQILVSGGKFVSASANTIGIKNTSFAITGGTIESTWENIAYSGGVLDLSSYPDPTGITVCVYGGGDVALPNENVKLPSGYGFAVKSTGEVANVLTSDGSTVYAVALVAEAIWGTEDDLTAGIGTLEEAIAAAESDPSISYVRLMTDVDSDYAFRMDDGTFTLDLNGKTLSADTYVIHWSGGNLTVDDTSRTKTGTIVSSDGASCISIKQTANGTLTVAGGTLVGGFAAISFYNNPTEAEIFVTGGTFIGGYAIGAQGKSLVVSGDAVLNGENHDIEWRAGTLSLIDHNDPRGIAVRNMTASSQTVALPEGYVFYNIHGNKVTTLEESTYTVDIPKYDLTVNAMENGNASASAKAFFSGDTVALAIEPDAGYIVDQIQFSTNTVFDPEQSTFVMPSEDLVVTVTFKPLQAVWGTAEDLTVGRGTLQEALYAAAENGAVSYVRLVDNVLLEQGGVFTNGGAYTLDLNGYTVSSPNYLLYLQNGVRITVTDTTNTSGTLRSFHATAILMGDSSAVVLTLEGGTVQGEYSAISSSNVGHETECEIVIRGGTLITPYDLIQTNGRKLTITGGTFIGESMQIGWNSGSIDLSAYSQPEIFEICYYGDETIDLPNERIALPEGYVLYNGDQIASTLENSSRYTVSRPRFFVSCALSDGGSVTIQPSEDKIAVGTTVQIFATPYDGYMVGGIFLDGVPMDSDTFVMPERDVHIDVLFKLRQAAWGTDADNLTGVGSLAEAIAAATAEGSTVGYIRLLAGILTDDVIVIEGGRFTLDLSGYEITSNDGTPLFLDGADVTIDDTVGNGWVIAYDGCAIEMEGAARLTLLNGAFYGHSCGVWLSSGESVLDLQGYSFADSIDLYNASSESLSVGEAVLLPEGYCVYDDWDDIVTVLAPEGEYYVDKIRYLVESEVGEGAEIELSIATDRILADTEVSFTLYLEDLATLEGVSINGGDVEYTYDADADEYRFLMPACDVTITVTTKYNVFVWGTSADEMTETGGLLDLAAAVNESDAVIYAKLLENYDYEPTSGIVSFAGKAVIDLDEYTLDLADDDDDRIFLDAGAEITFLSSAEDEDPAERFGSVYGAIEVKTGAKLSFVGAYAYADIYYGGGTVDVGGAHLASEFWLYNITEADVDVAEFLVGGARFRAIDYDRLEREYTLPTVPAVQTLESWDGESYGTPVRAVFTVSFDFGEGRGTLSPVETLYNGYRWLPKAEAVSHPEGLSVIGWSYESEDGTTVSADAYYHFVLSDVTLTAEWGAPLYVGGIPMQDGDYLAVGADKTTSKPPVTGGYAYYKDGVLILKDFTYTGNGFPVEQDSSYGNTYAFLYAADDLVIEIVGENSFTSGEDGYGIRVNGDLTLRGEGKLWLDAYADGIYALDVTVESGTVTVVSGRSALNVYNLTVAGGTLGTASYEGVYAADTVLVKGGALYVRYLDEYDNEVSLNAMHFTLLDGRVVIEGENGIASDFITVSGGVLEMETADYAIQNSRYTELAEDAFLTISGGKITIQSEEHGIFYFGDVTVSGGEIDIDAYHGIKIFEGSFTVSGGDIYVYANNGIMITQGAFTLSDGELYVEAQSGVYAYGSDVTVTGGYVSMYAELGIFLTEGDFLLSGGELFMESNTVGIGTFLSGGQIGHSITVTGGKVSIRAAQYGMMSKTLTIGGGEVVSSLVYAESLTLSGGQAVFRPYEEGGMAMFASTLTVSGTATVALVLGEAIVSQQDVNADEITVRTEEGGALYESKALTHTWSESYEITEDYHLHVCTDENCFISYVHEMFGDLNLYALYEEAAFGLHEYTDGEKCVCGYPVDEVLPEEPSDDALAKVGDTYLVSGDYLTADGTVVKEKPEGSYLYVKVETTDDARVGTLVLKDFAFTYSGMALLMLAGEIDWTVELVGESTLTANPDDTLAASENMLNVNGLGILLNNATVAIRGEGALTIHAQTGILAIYAELSIEDGARVSVNAQEDGIVVLGTSFTVGDAELCVNAGDDAIDGESANITLDKKSNVTLVAVDDGMDLSDTQLSVFKNEKLTVTVEDEGLNLSYVSFYLTEATMDITAGDDGIDGDSTIMEWENSTVNITADDRGITLSFNEEDMGGEPAAFTADGVTLNIVAGDDGLSVHGDEYYDEYEGTYDSIPYYVIFSNSVLNITAEDLSLEFSFVTAIFGLPPSFGGGQLKSSPLAISSGDGACQITLSGKGNDLYGSDVVFLGGKLTVFASEAAFALWDSRLGFVNGADVSIVSRGDGIFGQGSEIRVYNAALRLEAVRYGIYDGIDFSVTGDEADVTVRAAYAFDCEEVYLDGDFGFMTNAELDEGIFYDAMGNVASYVSIRSAQLVMDEMNEAVEALKELVSAGGSIESITDAMADVNALLGTLTNTEGVGRLDAVETAIAAIRTALAAVEQSHAEAQEKRIETDEALGSEIETLRAELTEADAKAKTLQTVTIVIAGVALGGNGALIALAIVLERKKKIFSTLLGHSSTKGE